MPNVKKGEKEEGSKFEGADDSSSVSSSDSHLCCCLCHCAVDYADREAFFKEDAQKAEEEDGKKKKKPALLPESMYDAHNALVLCDTCDRPFHQQCHFVPLIPLPRGDWHCLVCKSENDDDVHPFPPQATMTQATHEWEYETRSLKAHQWKREFSRVQRAISTQLQQVRMAQDTLRAYTSSRRSQQFLSLRSQELCQTVWKLASCKKRIREWFIALEQVWKTPTQSIDRMVDYCKEHPSLKEIWFPQGMDMERRVVPRLIPEKDNGVPTQVVIKTDGVVQETQKEEEDDDLITLDDLQCCICFRGDATDENDVLLCDGKGCFRAYHMQCVSPHVTLEQVENEDDWFCPFCTNMAKLIANVQSEYTGDEWGGGGGDEDTIHSWEHVEDVFPEADQEYEMALKWKKGQFDEEMTLFISDMLGVQVQGGGKSSDEDDDDDPEDDDFDLDAFQNRKRADDESSVASSHVTLQDMGSSVELNVDMNELNALSSASSDEEDDDDDNNGGVRRRRSRRSSRAASPANNSTGSSTKSWQDTGALDESNILQGKRRRKQVDYRKLNDSMFGDISESTAFKLFDDETDEYKVQSNGGKRRRDSESSSNSSDDEDSRSSETSSSGQNGKATRKKRGSSSKRSSYTSDEESVESDSDAEEGKPTKKRGARKSAKNGTKQENANGKRKRGRPTAAASAKNKVKQGNANGKRKRGRSAAAASAKSEAKQENANGKRKSGRHRGKRARK